MVTPFSRRTLEEASHRVYGFVEDVAEPIDKLSTRARHSIRFDIVDADVFDEIGAAVDDPAALGLLRVSTTISKFVRLLGEADPLFGGRYIRESEWLELEIGRCAGRPRAWLLDADREFVPPTPLHVLSMRRPSTERVALLEAACRLPDAPRETADRAVQELASLLTNGDIRIIALDVGQAAAVALHSGGRCVGFFDIGRPTSFNGKSFPSAFYPPWSNSGIIVLSHWDYDHFAMAKHVVGDKLRNFLWFAPDQPVSMGTRRFQQSLGSNLVFIDGNAVAVPVTLSRCNGAASDRNANGYVMRIDLPGGTVLLTGDADYDRMPQGLSTGVQAMMLPHHTGGTSPPPKPKRLRCQAVASYGAPNNCKHPNPSQIDAHEAAGWMVTATANTTAQGRGDRRLYPLTRPRSSSFVGSHSVPPANELAAIAEHAGEHRSDGE